MPFINATLQLVLLLLITNALELKRRFQYSHVSEGVNDLTVAKFPESSHIGCARLCSRYPGCISFSLASGLCTLLTAWHSVRLEQGGATFIMKEVEPSCLQEGGSNGGAAFNFSSAYYASYQQITRIRISYRGGRMNGLEVHHGNNMEQTGLMNGVIRECKLMDGEFIQRWDYSIYKWKGRFNVVRCNTLVTTHKTCNPAPYGTSCGTMKALEGYHLLYVAGRRLGGFDRISLAFDSC